MELQLHSYMHHTIINIPITCTLGIKYYVQYMQLEIFTWKKTFTFFGSQLSWAKSIFCCLVLIIIQTLCDHYCMREIYFSKAFLELGEIFVQRKFSTLRYIENQVPYQCLCDDGPRCRPGKHLYLTGSVKYHISIDRQQRKWFVQSSLRCIAPSLLYKRW